MTCKQAALMEDVKEQRKSKILQLEAENKLLKDKITKLKKMLNESDGLSTEGIMLCEYFLEFLDK